VKTELKGKRFLDVENIKTNMTAELNAVSLEAFAVFKNFLNDCTNEFRLYYSFMVSVCPSISYLGY
jgi:hypothetical protein